MEKINEYIVPYHWYWKGFYLYRYLRPVKLILNQFSKNDCVLDVGCGDGRITSLIAPRVKSVIGVDNQDRALKFARLIYESLDVKNVRFEKQSVSKLNFKGKTFDKVTCFDVIEHMPVDQVEKSIQEMHRVLKKDGRIYLTTPNRDELAGRIFGHKVIDKHYYEYNVQEMVEMFKPYFKNIKVNGYYITLFPKVGRYPDVFPFKSFFRFLVDMGHNFPTLSFAFLIQGTKK